jgi:hypothetical protein
MTYFATELFLADQSFDLPSIIVDSTWSLDIWLFKAVMRLDQWSCDVTDNTAHTGPTLGDLKPYS